MPTTSSRRLRRGMGAAGMTVALLALMVPAGTAAAGRVGPTAAELAGIDPVTSGPRRCVVRHDGVAYSTLQAGVDAAEPGETVTVQGTCVGFTLIAKDLTIRGVRTSRSGHPTLHGQRTIPLLWIGGDLAPVRMRPAGPTEEPGSGSVVTIDGLRIVRGFAGDDGVITLSYGAGVILRDTIVARNRGTENGAIFGYDLNLIVLRGTTEIRGNRAIDGDGGGVDAGAFGRVELHGTSSIHHNRSWDDGGGILADQGTDIVMNDDSSIYDNLVISDDDGAGVKLESDDVQRPSLTMNDRARIHGNRSTDEGGGVRAYQADIILNDSARIENNAAHDGGGISGYEATVTLNDNARVSGNVAAHEGGGIEMGVGTVTLNDASRVSGNAAMEEDGGGIWASSSTVTLSGSSRVSGNRSGEEGAGIDLGSGSTFRMEGTARVSGNRSMSDDGGGIVVFNGSTAVLAGASVVEQNRADGLGGGIRVDGYSSLDFDDTAVVRQNIAANDGGGVYAEACAIVTDLVTGTNVLSNTPNDFVQPVC